MTLNGSGDGGFDQLVQSFDQKQVMFGVLKVLGKDVRKSVESIRPKFIFFTFIGEEVPVLQRARVSVQRPDVEKIFNGYAVRMDISGACTGDTDARGRSMVVPRASSLLVAFVAVLRRSRVVLAVLRFALELRPTARHPDTVTDPCRVCLLSLLLMSQVATCRPSRRPRSPRSSFAAVRGMDAARCCSHAHRKRARD